MNANLPYLGPMQGTIPKSQPSHKTRRVEMPDNCLPILAFDPGGTLGWSLLVLPRRLLETELLYYDFDTILRRKMLWHHGQILTKINENLAMYRICRLLEEWPNAAVVFEGFVLRKPQKGEDVVSPVRQNAMLQYYLWRNGRNWFVQDPSLKATANDVRLHNWGVYNRNGGLEHARDADRHVLIFLMQLIKDPGLWALAWPNIYKAEEKQDVFAEKEVIENA